MNTKPTKTALKKMAPELYDSLKFVTRILEAVRYSAGLGPDQVKRLFLAKDVLAKTEGKDI